jgi:Flp pilus assembly protein TadD
VVNYNLIKDLAVPELQQLAKNFLKEDLPDEALRVASLALEKGIDDPTTLFILGQVYLKSDKEPIAEIIFRKALELDPSRAELWGSVGRSIDPYRRPEEAIKYLLKAHSLRPDSTSPMVNVANAYNRSGQYEKALEWSQKVLDLDADSPAGNDNNGMSRVALGDYAGFDGMNYGLGGRFRPETQYGIEERWNGQPDQTIIAYSEQGLGDEILYGSCLPDLIEDCDHVIIDCDKRVEGLFKRSFPEASVYGTRRMEASWPNKHVWHGRVSFGALPMHYRRKKSDFPGVPFLKADPVRRLQWRAVLDSLPDRPKVGIAWSGGVKLTARHLRSIGVEMFEPLLEVAELVDLSHELKDYDLPIHRWEHGTITDNYDDTAALVSELDAVVTVCTAVVHLAGGLGVPTFVMPPSTPSWRYNQTDMPWYDSVKIIPFEDSWENSINQAKDEIRKLIELRKVA